MQIGSRWVAGATPHPAVPDTLLPLIAQADADGHEGSWTLTWLEGRPICMRDDEVSVILDQSNTPQLAQPDDDEDEDDDWLVN